MIQYLTENEMIWKLREYCAFGEIANRYSYNIRKKEQEKSYVHKFNESKGKRILQKKYLKAKCGTNHCYLEEDLDLFIKDYLEPC